MSVCLTRRPQLDGLRFFLFLAVFVFHCDPRFSFLSYGVSGFFVLSGFLITTWLATQEGRSRGQTLATFYLRRALRIFPAYYVVLTAAVLLGSIRYAGWHYATLFNLKLFLLGIPLDKREFLVYAQNWEDQGAHFWTLCVAVQFYLCYGLLFLFAPARLRTALLAALCALSIGGRALLHTTNPYLYSGVLLPIVGEYLLWGCLLGWLNLRGHFRKDHARSHFYLGALCIALAWGAHRPSHPALATFQPQLVQQTVLALGFGWFVLGLWNADASSMAVRFLSLRPLRYLGKLSYGLYLVHLFTWGMTARLVVAWPTLRGSPEVPARFGLTVVLAALLWHTFESRLNALKDRVSFGGR